MNVLSLFDGISCGQVALQRAGLFVNEYFASEIDKHAIAVAMKNFSNTTQLGDVSEIRGGVLPRIDLLIGGSPCQSISGLGKRDGLAGKSGLFYEYLRLKEETSPTYFLLENVVGNRKSVDEISKCLGVEPVLIDSKDFSAQNRKRFYWTNIEIKPHVKCQTTLIEILDEELKSTSVLTEARLKWLLSEKGQNSVKKKYTSIDPVKAQCLTARSDASWNSNYVTRDGVLTKLSCEEYEKLQTLPVGYTSSARTSERYKMIGNAWTVDVIAHILKGIPK